MGVHLYYLREPHPPCHISALIRNGQVRKEGQASHTSAFRPSCVGGRDRKRKARRRRRREEENEMGRGRGRRREKWYEFYERGR